MPADAIARLGSRAFQLLDPGTSVQLTFRDDRLEVLERVRGELRVRDAATGETLETLSAGRGRITPATRSHDGSWIALGCSTVTFQTDGRDFRLSSPNRPPPSELRGTGGLMRADHYRLRCVDFDARGATAVVAFETFPAVQRVDLESGTAETVEGVRCRPNAVAIAPGGERFACAGHTKVAVVEGTEVREYGGEGRPHALAFSADGQELAIGYPGEVRVVDAGTFEVRARIRTRPQEPRALALSADGRWIATAAEGAIDVWDRQSGRPVPTPIGHGGAVTSVALGDGVVLSSAGSGEVLRWRIDRPARAEVLLPPAAFWRKLTGSADGRTFVAYWRDPEIDERRLQRLSPEGAAGEVQVIGSTSAHMELAPDGSFLVLSTVGGVDYLALDGEVARTLWREGRAGGRGVVLSDGRVAVGAAHADTTVEILPSDCAPDCDGRVLTTPAPPQPQSSRTSGLGDSAFARAMAGGLGGAPRQPRPSAHDPGPTNHDAGLKDAVLAGERIVTTTRGGELHVFDAASLERIGCWGARVERLEAHGSGRVFALDALGNLLLLPEDVPSPQGRSCSRLEATRWEGAHEGEGTDLDVRGDVVATAGTDGTIVLWSVEELLARERAGS